MSFITNHVYECLTLLCKSFFMLIRGKKTYKSDLSKEEQSQSVSISTNHETIRMSQDGEIPESKQFV